MLTVDEISTAEELTRLEAEWCQLLTRSQQATPFQHPGWVLPWWKYFGSGRLFVIAVRDRGTLVALAPMFLHAWQERRQITLLGTGRSDYLDVIADPAYASFAMQYIYDHLEQQADVWDLCDWQDLSAASPAVKTIPVRLPHEYTISDPCVAISLPGDTAQWLAALPHGLRRNLRRYRNRLEQHGSVVFAQHEADSDGTLMKALFDLHTRRWQLRGGEGVLNSETLEGFHREACSRLEGLLRFYTMRLDGRIVAIVYGYQHAQTFYSYLGGFDPDLTSFSPGALILQYGIEQAIAEGVLYWDFLRGQESYKFDWGGVIIPKHRLWLTAPLANEAVK